MATTITYKGFSTTSPSNTLYDLEIGKADLMNHFMTRKGERVMAPQFGSIIWDFIFDPLTLDLMELIKQDCIDIVNADPRFGVQSVNLSEIEHGILLEMELIYYPQDLVDVLAITFDNRATGA
jgi:phage baseplate assembly protein W